MFVTSANALRRKSASWIAITVFCGQLVLAPVQAADVIWNTPLTMTADTNVRTYGSLVGAFDMAASESTTTINGVSFAGTVAGGSSVAFSSVATLEPAPGASFLGAFTWSAAPVSPPLSANYAALNDSSAIVANGPMTLTLNSLTPGRSYMLQTWVGDTRQDGAYRSQTLTGGALTSGTMLFNSTGADGGNGSFVVGNFVANSTSQVVTITGSPDNVPMLNAFQLRDVTDVMYTWTASGASPLTDGGGTWNAADVNWATGTSVGTWGDATSDIAVFGVGSGTAGTVTVGAVALNGITFNAAGSGNYTLSSGTLALGGTSPTIQTNAAGTSTIASVISGSAGLIKTGGGTLALSGANAYTGGNTIEAGTVQVGDPSALGDSSNALNVTGGTLDLNGTSVSVGRLSGLAGTVITTNAAAGTATLSTTVASGSSTFAGTIQDNGPGVVALTKAGAGTLALTALNTFTGATTVDDGTLWLSNGGPAGIIRGPLTINAGATVSTGWWSLGYAGGTPVAAITINGGTLDLRTNAFGSPATITMTGGQITGSQAADVYSATDTAPTFATLASSTTATISAGLALRFNGNDANQVAFNVAAGSAPSGVDLLISGPITKSANALGGGGIAKSGAGVLRLSAVNAYTGATTVSAGRLEIAPGGSINSSSGVTLNGATAELKYNSGTALTAPLTFTQGTISGTGAIGTAVTAGSGAILSPGNSPGIQAYTAGLAWNPAGTYAWELNALTGAAGTNWDRLDVTGGLDLTALSAGSKFNLNLITLTSGNVAGPLGSPYAPGSSYQFTIATFDTLSVPGAFSNAAGSDLTSLFAISLSGWQGTQPNLADISVKVNSGGTGIDLVVVPEPAAWALAGIGIAAAAWIRRRSLKK